MRKAQTLVFNKALEFGRAPYAIHYRHTDGFASGCRHLLIHYFTVAIGVIPHRRRPISVKDVLFAEKVPVSALVNTQDALALARCGIGERKAGHEHGLVVLGVVLQQKLQDRSILVVARSSGLAELEVLLAQRRPKRTHFTAANELGELCTGGIASYDRLILLYDAANIGLIHLVVELAVFCEK